MYRGNHFVIILEHRSTDHTKIPSGVANIACLYLFEDEMARPPVPQARCIIESTPGNPDNGEFTTLQPGLRITSAYLPSSSGTFLSTTTGVLVKDGAGNEYMTVASHGFPTECGAQVTHPLPTLGRNIGELIMKVPHTDISLVKLHNGETFSNIAFQNEITAEPVQLRRLAKSMDSRIGDWVFLGSPGGGCIGGSLKLTSYQRILDDGENESEESWIFTSWFYMGQESASSLPDGMCGSAIWREDGDVIGFFRYAPMGGAMKDWCCGTAADELIDRGFTMVDTTDRQAG
ncbi:hypothetical protein F5884DRAFT_776275 [Xylogone sp. PMI_703]|nr:hypothetical protein F5884DRAFT_776275 [Xylogone sp. PMI_703]